MSAPASESEGRTVVLVTAPSADEAARIARTLVDERLCACANIVAPVRSIYRWEGKLCDEGEAMIVIKTRAALFDRLSARVREIHPYDVPEIIALPLTAGSDAYLRWIDETATGG